MDILNSLPNELLKKTDTKSDKNSPENPKSEPKIEKESNNNNSKSPKQDAREVPGNGGETNKTLTLETPETQISDLDPVMPKVSPIMTVNRYRPGK